jgi:hypothetical protein
MKVHGKLLRRGVSAISVEVEWDPAQTSGTITFPEVIRLLESDCMLTVENKSYPIVIQNVVDGPEGTRAAFQTMA